MIEEKWRPVFGDLLDFHTAVDRRDLENGTIPMPPAGPLHPAFRRKLSTGELACALSHVSALERNAGGAGGAIIMEDDINPEPHASMVFDLIRAARAEFGSLDILLLCKPVNAFTTGPQATNVLMADGRRPPWGSTMVWYGPDALRDQAARISAFDTPADHWTDFCRDGRVGVLRTPVALHVGADTYIGNAHRGPSSHREYRP